MRYLIGIALLISIVGCAHNYYYSPRYMMDAKEVCESSGGISKFDPNTGRFECGRKTGGK